MYVFSPIDSLSKAGKMNYFKYAQILDGHIISIYWHQTGRKTAGVNGSIFLNSPDKSYFMYVGKETLSPTGILFSMKIIILERK